jgi:hypothetical protein
MAMSDQSLPPVYYAVPPAPPPPPGRLRTLLLVALVGLVLGGGGVGVSWLLVDRAHDASSAAGEARTACLTVAGSGAPSGTTTTAVSRPAGVGQRWQAAGVMAGLASADDPRYVPLTLAINDVAHGIAGGRGGSPEVALAYQRVHTLCMSL